MKSTKYQQGVVITATEFKQNLGKYMEYVVDNQTDVVITKNGSKIARVTPYVTDLEQYFVVRENALDYQYGGKKVSYAEFMEITEKSTLRMELINGEIHLLASPTIGHQEILGRLYILFNAYFQYHSCRVFLAPFDVHFNKKGMDEPDVMQPDLIVVCDLKGNVTEKDRYMGTPSLVIEILSDSTRSKDMIDKLNTYRLSGVEEYWVIDPKAKTVLIYQFKDREIERVRSFEGGSTVQSFIFDGLSADIDPLFQASY